MLRITKSFKSAGSEPHEENDESIDGLRQAASRTATMRTWRLQAGRRCMMVGATALASLVLAGCDAPNSRGPAAEASSDRVDFEPQPDPNGTARLTAALDHPDPFARARLLGKLLPALGPEALSQVKGVLGRFRTHLGAVEFELLLRFWAEQEPEAATLWIFKHNSARYRASASRTAIEIWAEKDPAAALVAVESVLSRSDKDVWRAVQMGLVRGWLKADRAGLEHYIHDLGVGIPRQRSLAAFALTLAEEQGSDAVIRWAESIPEDDAPYKRDVYRQVLSALAWGDMDAAVRFCDAHCDGPFGGRLRVVLIRSRLRNGEEGSRILEWIGGLPAEDEDAIEHKRHELQVAYGFWAHLDRPSALLWMQKRLSEDERPGWLTHLIGEFTRHLAADSPAEAIRWAEKIEDPNERQLTLVRVARRWLKEDEAAAKAWLETSSLTDLARNQARDTSAPDYLPPPVESD